MTPAEFTATTAGLAYQPRGVLFSELYMFAACCQDRGVTAIAESGVRNGGSTRVLRRLFADVTSFDKAAAVIPPDLRAVVTIADGREAIPAWVNARPGQALAVLLDGPKGPKGDVVRGWCLGQPQVRLVAQHDCVRGHDEDWHSQTPAFRAETGDCLDARVPANVMARFYQRGKGLGIWFGRAA